MVKLDLKEIELVQVIDSSFQNFCRKVCEDVATKKRVAIKITEFLKSEKTTAKIKSEFKVLFIKSRESPDGRRKREKDRMYEKIMKHERFI